VIIKLPFPYLGDKFIKARMARDPSWYTWQTALTMVQATGRSIRSGDDYAITYVLDSDFSFFLAKANSILPKWWMDSIVYHP
jgi:Rad3-related DNA helicase